MNSFNNKKGLVIVVALMTMAIVWRLLNNHYGFAYNLELVTIAGVIAALAFGWRAGLAVPVAIMVVTDAIIGNDSKILAFTWGSFALIGLSAALLRKLNDHPSLQILSGASFGLVASIAFFLITNFGVWMLGYYTTTLDGLITSYAMGIPFYKNMLVGNLVLVPSAIAAWQFTRSHAPIRQASVHHQS